LDEAAEGADEQEYDEQAGEPEGEEGDVGGLFLTDAYRPLCGFEVFCMSDHSDESDPEPPVGELPGIHANEADSEVMALGSDEPYVIRIGVDSCASATVIPRELCSEFGTIRDDLAGRLYRTANNQGVEDEGLRKVVGRIAGQGDCRLARFRVAKVSRPLMCVADMVDAGQRVVFDRNKAGRDCSYVEDKSTNVKTPIVRKNRVYELELHVERASCPFPGQCRRM